LGGANHESEVLPAYVRALGYNGLDEFCQAFADLLRQPSEREDRHWGIRARTHQAQCKLLEKFGYDLRRASPADLADAAYRIMSTLPEEWRATIRSAHGEWCDAEATANQMLELAEEMLAEPDGAKMNQGSKMVCRKRKR